MRSGFYDLAQAEIEKLYEECGLPTPSPEQCIVPLSKLLQTLPLTQHELSNLTAPIAFDFLLGRGAIIQRPENVSDEPLAGFLYANAAGGSLFVRREDPISRRRFSVAHELGHYLLHLPLFMEAGRLEDREGEVELVEALPPSDNQNTTEVSNGRLETTRHPPTKGLPSFEQMEREADAFAAELLMPAPVIRTLRQQFGSHWSDVDLIWRLSNEMLVSRAAMGFRLRGLGLLRDESALMN